MSIHMYKYRGNNFYFFHKQSLFLSMECLNRKSFVIGPFWKPLFTGKWTVCKILLNRYIYCTFSSHTHIWCAFLCIVKLSHQSSSMQLTTCAWVVCLNGTPLRSGRVTYLKRFFFAKSIYSLVTNVFSVSKLILWYLNMSSFDLALSVWTLFRDQQL